MTLSFLPYGRQTVSESDIAEVVSVLKSPFLTQGNKVPEFETSFALKHSAKFATVTNSATSSLHIACLALNLNPGDIVWTSPITFVASANCARYCGASVDFVDINPLTGLMSVEALSNKLKKARKNNALPKIVIPVHYSGTSCDMQEIFELSKEYGFHIIEDASHAVGAYYQDFPVGCCKYSDICVFSFHPVKIITTGEGGIATTNDIEYKEKMEAFRSHGITKDSSRFLLDDKDPWVYEQQRLGFNYRMTDIQAALGLSQLLRLEHIVNERNRLLKLYKEQLCNTPIQFLEIPSNCYSSVHLAVIMLYKCKERMQSYLYHKLKEHHVGSQVHYMPVHLQPYYRKLGFNEGNFPHSESFARSVLSIPLYPGLTDEQVSHVSQLISMFVS